MKGLFSIGSALVTLFLVTANAWQPTFQFFDNSVGTRFCRGCMQCLVQSNSPQYSFSAIIGNDYCSNLNGKMSVATSYRNLTGTLTVDFSPDVPGNTGMYMSFPNGTWIGGIAPSKVSGNSAIVNMNGTGQWGSTNYVGGWCVAEVTQSQKVQPSDAVTNPDAQYSYNISLYDNSRNWIGGTTDGPLFVQGGKTGGIDSMLPKVFEITSGCKSSLFLFNACDSFTDLSRPGFRPFHYELLPTISAKPLQRGLGCVFHSPSMRYGQTSH